MTQNQQTTTTKKLLTPAVLAVFRIKSKSTSPDGIRWESHWDVTLGAGEPGFRQVVVTADRS